MKQTIHVQTGAQTWDIGFPFLLHLLKADPTFQKRFLLSPWDRVDARRAKLLHHDQS